MTIAGVHMHLIVYTSKYTGLEEEIDSVLNNICLLSKRNNFKHDITGVLFYHNKRFLQIIEGNIDPLEKLMTILEHDARHKNIERLIDSSIPKRSFQA